MSFFITKIIQFFLFIVGLIPVKAIHVLSRWAIFVFFSKMKETSKTTSANLRLAFPELDEIDIQSLTKKSLLETLRVLGELGLAWSRLPGNNLLSHIEIKGLNKVSKSLEKKKGLILFTPHLSNIEIMLNSISRELSCMALYTPSKNQYMNQVMLAARRKMGAEMVEPNMAGVKSMLSNLKQGGVVIIASDQVPNLEGGLLSNFFSTPALTMTVDSKLKLKTGAPCHSVYCLRKPQGEGFEVVYSEEIEGMDLDIKSSVDRMNEELEKCIMNAPEQYAWEYKRYKHSGLKNIY
jgi:KDO2-lipid IV(A) lauroyltransferase